MDIESDFPAITAAPTQYQSQPQRALCFPMPVDIHLDPIAEKGRNKLKGFIFLVFVEIEFSIRERERGSNLGG